MPPSICTLCCRSVFEKKKKKRSEKGISWEERWKGRRIDEEKRDGGGGGVPSRLPRVMCLTTAPINSNPDVAQLIKWWRASAYHIAFC